MQTGQCSPVPRNGVRQLGGFIAALVSVGVISMVLAWVGGADPGPEAFRIAMATQLPVWLFALTMVLRSRRKLLATGQRV